MDEEVSVSLHWHWHPQDWYFGTYEELNAYNGATRSVSLCFGPLELRYAR